MKTSQIISVGLAMFAMLFGAGNVVFPLALGRDMGSMVWVALGGFALTAILVPLLGLVSTMLSDGQYDKFLGRLGRIPGFLIGLVCMIIIGPFAMTPRCITISHAAVKLYMPSFTMVYFSIFCAVIIYLLTFRQSSVIDVIGRFLGPIKLTLLVSVILVGIFYPAAFMVSTISGTKSFLTGLLTGYKTADLLGTVFFSGLILSGIKKSLNGQDNIEPKQLAMYGLKAGTIGALLLGAVYTGFCIVAGFNSQGLQGVPDGDVFSILADLVLGNVGGLFANITVAVSCLTTAVALTTVFADYLQRVIFNNKVTYLPCLYATIGITAVMSNLGFDKIMELTMPLLTVLYPGLVVLAIVNFLNVLYGFKWIKTPVFTTLIISALLQYWDKVQAFWMTSLI